MPLVIGEQTDLYLYPDSEKQKLSGFLKSTE